MTLSAALLAAATLSASASGVLLSPRAASNQMKTVPGNAVVQKAPAKEVEVVWAPRAADNRIKTVASTTNNRNPKAECQKNMTGSPKAVQACIESGNMSGCRAATVAPLK